MIGEERWQKLIKHLEILEEAVGSKLRASPRYHGISCPICNFAPDGHGSFKFYGASYSGIVHYSEKDIKIYDFLDRAWWHSLSKQDKEETTERIIKWIAERK